LEFTTLANLYNKKKAFTLAELLVAMFVFAMISVLLIPNVVNNAEKNLFTSQLKAAHNNVQQGLLLIIAENQGTLQSFCTGSDPNACFLKQLVGEYDNNVKTMSKGKLSAKIIYGTNADSTDSDTASNPEKNASIQKTAFDNRNPLLLDKTTTPAIIPSTYIAANLANGASISPIFMPKCSARTKYDDVVEPESNVCGVMEIDINAGKKPNIVGKDIHYFWIVDKDGLVPFGEIDNST